MRRRPLFLGLATGLLLASLPSFAPAGDCPTDLSHVVPRLVTPWEDLKAFIGEEALTRTLTRPIDDMIAQGGGLEPSLEAGRRYVEEYEEILANEPKVREGYRARGQTDEWIDVYIMSVLDGITINQAFIDAVLCRKRNR